MGVRVSPEAHNAAQQALQKGLLRCFFYGNHAPHVPTQAEFSMATRHFAAFHARLDKAETAPDPKRAAHAVMEDLEQAFATLKQDENALNVAASVNPVRKREL